MILSHAQEWGLKTIRETPAEFIIGVDEVGLGAIAGPFVVCATVFPKNWTHPSVKDSKQFNAGDSQARHEKRRKALEEFHPDLLYRAIEIVPGKDVDALGMGPALEDAMRRVALQCSHAYPDSVVALDGDRKPYLTRVRAVTAIPKGDELVPAIGAASIIAKITRDAMMFLNDGIYPGYGFVDHVGYLTAAHQEALDRLGPCDIHRRSCKPVQVAEYRKSRSG